MGNCLRCENRDEEVYPAGHNEFVGYNQNLAFYRNERPASPNRENIETILTTWGGNYDKLEKNHDYIQWLFPNREPGVNRHAFVLTDLEAQEIQNTEKLKNRVRRAFEMMLDFYGTKLTEYNFERTVNHKERFLDLNQRDNHNFLRITRILLALKELGHKDLMLPWLKFLSELIFEDGALENAEYSFTTFWKETLDADDRLKLDRYLVRYSGEITH